MLIDPRQARGQSVTLGARSIGDFVFDVTTAEAHTSTLRITENPVELGAQIADHVVLEPKEVTVTGVMVDYRPATRQTLISSLLNVRGGAGFLNDIPLPAILDNITAQTQVREIRELTSFVAQADLSLQELARPVAPWLPEFMPFGKADADKNNGRVAQAYEQLLTIQKSGSPITVKTGMHNYDDMLITAIGVTQTKDGSGEFSITLREIFIVETQSVSGVKVPTAGANKSGRAGKQSADKTQKGSTQTKATEQEVSILGKIGLK